MLFRSGVDEALFAEFFAAIGAGFGDAVGIERQRVARVQGGRAFGTTPGYSAWRGSTWHGRSPKKWSAAGLNRSPRPAKGRLSSAGISPRTVTFGAVGEPGRYSASCGAPSSRSDWVGCTVLLEGESRAEAVWRFAMTSPPSGCQKDFHPQAVKHARHTTKKAPRQEGVEP